MMTPEQYRFMLRSQIAIGLTIAGIGIVQAIVVATFVPWLVPVLAVLWAMGALPIATRLSTVGVASRSLFVAAFAIAIAALARLAYLASHHAA